MRSIMDSDDVLIDDEVHKYELLTVFGFYWRMMSQVGYLFWEYSTFAPVMKSKDADYGPKSFS